MKALAIATLAIALSVTAWADERPAPGALYREFEAYQAALANENANLTPFFSRQANEELMGPLLEVKDSNLLLKRLEVNRARYRFGDSIAVVHSYREDINGGGSALLHVEYDGKKSNVQIVDLIYLLENGRWRIDRLNFSSSHTREGASLPVIERFH